MANKFIWIFLLLFYFYAQDRRLGGILFLSCLSFCHSVLLSETLTLLITFEQWVLELWYFTGIFLVIRPFRGYHYFWPCDLDLEAWPIFWKLNFVNNFWTVSARALIFHLICQILDNFFINRHRVPSGCHILCEEERRGWS